MKLVEDILTQACQADTAYRHLVTAFGEWPMPCMECGEEATRLVTLTSHGQLRSAWPSWPSHTRGCR